MTALLAQTQLLTVFLRDRFDAFVTFVKGIDVFVSAVDFLYFVFYVNAVYFCKVVLCSFFFIYGFLFLR